MREIVIIFVVALVGGYFAFKIKLPPLLGYLIGGMCLSLPFFSNIIDFDFSRNIAQFGVALLLFTTGLEFPVSKLLTIKKSIIIGTILHLALFIFLGGFVFSKFGMDTYSSFFLTASFANSGTVIILYLLEKGMKLDIKTTETVIGWLIIQDLAMILITVFITTISQTGGVYVYDILEALAKSMIFIIIGGLLGKSIIPAIFESLSRMESSEILLITALVLCVAVAYFAEVIGLSFTIGAFFAGVMISESFVNHAVFSEVKPLRDLFAIIFYVSLGTLLSFSFLFSNIVMILLVLIGLLLVKFLIGFGIILVLDEQTRKAFTISLTLAQGGEFAFILAQMGLENQWIDTDFFSLIILVSIFSLLLTPLSLAKADDWYKTIRSFIRQRSNRLYNLLFVRLDRLIDVDHPELINHVVICGFGRVGSYVGRALEKNKIPYIVIDSSSEVIDYCKQRGIKFVFGDASNLDVLEKADVERASSVVVALPKEVDVEIITQNSRKLNPSIKIIARSHIPYDDKRLKGKGVSITVEPEFEAAVSISKKLLNYYGEPGANIGQYLKKSRRRQRSKMD